MTDTRIEMMVAERAIRRLLSAYGDAVRRLDAEAAAPLFAPDVRIRIAHFPERVGREAAVEGLHRTMSNYSFMHQICENGLIDVIGDRARARLGVLEINRLHGADTLNAIAGIYEDEYALLTEGWRFHRRHFTLQTRAVVPLAEMEEFPKFIPAFVVMP